MDLLDTTSTQRPLLDVLVLFSYPVSLSAAVSVSTWLAVAVAGVWIWRLVSHQPAAAARSKEAALSTAAASHLFRPQPTTAVCLLLHRQEEEEEEEIEPPCSTTQAHVPAPVLVDVQEAICAGTRKAVIYFEGHGGPCRGPSSLSSLVPKHHDQDDYAQYQAVHPSPTSTRWCCDDARSSCVVRYYDVASHEADQQQDRDTTPSRDDDAPYRTMPVDLGFRRFQDWRVIDGNVVRLWHASPTHHKHQHQHLLLLQQAAARTSSSVIGPVAVASPLFP